MQILERRSRRSARLDDGKLADHIRKTSFPTVVGDIKFGDRGEWAEPRVLYVQYHDIVGNDVEQFKQAGKQVILYPPRYKSGEVQAPVRVDEELKRQGNCKRVDVSQVDLTLECQFGSKQAYPQQAQGNASAVADRRVSRLRSRFRIQD